MSDKPYRNVKLEEEPVKVEFDCYGSLYFVHSALN